MLLVSLIASAAAAPCRIAELCAPLLPGRVRPDECSVERLKVGNTNVLHRLDTVAGDRYLVRQFGKQAALAFDRDRENAIFLALADAELAPACIATWPDGRIEGWIDGQPCTADECRQLAVSERVAEGLAALHSQSAERRANRHSDRLWYQLSPFACRAARSTLLSNRRVQFIP